MSSRNINHKIGITYAVAAYIGWGILPIYWKSVEQVSALQLMHHRIVWSFLFAALLITLKKQWPEIKQVVTNWKTILLILGCSLIISANWLIYIWSINNNHVIESSLGYYINPLINIAIGTIIFRDRLDKWQWIAIFLAITGVVIQTVEFGKIPWIALSLAFTFAIYGLLKKLLKVDALVAITLETMMVFPIALGYLLFVEISGTGIIGNTSISVIFLVICSGVITFLPLLWFGQAARRIPLSTLGFLQYIEPTINLLLGIFFFHENFSRTDLVSFGFIWLALAIYIITQINIRNNIKKINLVDEETETSLS
ncbi:EamA family transporter RarD [Shimazuella kribbensis]|uniref:EamA family transporter RarD n=1 Tax=Shimazuella kribbensis TaxID=139808 RepID=UPI0004131CC3|nr:EamA family transporter RarD [Shimazuella kribbensis]